MQNPFASQPEASPYTNLKERVFKNVQATRVNDRIFEVVQRAYEEALAMENIVLSLPERRRLLSQILKMVLEDMLKKLEKK